jgi:hypothetical protein
MSIDEFSASVGAAADSVEAALTAIHAAKDTGEGLAGQLAGLGLETKTAQTHSIAERLESEAAAAAAALKTKLEELRQEVEGLKQGGLQGGGTSPRTANVPATDSGAPPSAPAAPTFTPAGTWATPPKRSFGNPFNAEYEEWVKTANGGPAGDLEYHVIGPSGKAVWFDAQRIEDTGTGKVEYLIDAKGNYGQFVQPDGTFKWFFRERGGLEHTRQQAERQVRAAGGRHVEWWCADEEFADALNDYLDRDVYLRGKIEAIHKPYPEEQP